MGMSANAIRAGKAAVEIWADDSQARRVLLQFQRRMASWGATINSMGRQAFMLGAAATGGLVLLSKRAADAASQLVDLADRTGITVESLSQLKFAAEQSGSGIEDLEVGIKKMDRIIAEAAMGSNSAAEALGHLGLAAGDLINMAPDRQFELIADRISQIPNPTFRAALALELFGKSGTKLLPMMVDGAKGLEAFRKQADALGITLSTKDAKALEAWGDSFDALRAVLKAGVLTIGSSLLPVLVPMTARSPKSLPAPCSGSIGIARWSRRCSRSPWA